MLLYMTNFFLNKKQGQVFTPLSIVEYMVKTSFDELYKTDLYNKQGFYKILEPSCGDGRFVKVCLDYADKHNLKIKIVAIDIDQNWINFCKENIKDKRVKFICGNTLLIKKRFNIVKNFDLVIGNPPYIQLQKNGGELGNLYKDAGYQSFARTGDIYQLFYELGYNLLKTNGILSFITSNKWMRAGYGKTTRQFLATKTNPLILLDMGANVFESATVDSNILLYQKANNQGQTRATKVSKQELVEGQPNFAIINFDSSDGWFIGTPAQIALKKKIEANGKPLKDWDVKINCGIKTGLNEAFIIDEAKKDELIAKDPKSAEIIKPILRGRDIKRYCYEFANIYILFIPWHFPLHKYPNITGASLEAEKEFEKQYPAIYYHLLEYKENLAKRNKSETGIRYEWYALQRCANTYYEEFEKEKVVYQEITQSSCFAYDKHGEFFVSNTGYLLTGENLKFLTAVLNSILVNFAYKAFYCTTLGENGVRWLFQHVQNVPIPLLDTPEKQAIASKIESLVNQILEEKSPLYKRSEPQARGVSDTTNKTKHLPSPTVTPSSQEGQTTAHLENQIDDLVFELYGLSEEEIEVIRS